MRVTVRHEESGSWALVAHPEDYDGHPPVSRIMFDREARMATPDRLALASYLFFGANASASFETPMWHSPALAQAMVEDAAPNWLQTRPVELYAKSITYGHRLVSVTLEGNTAEFGDTLSQSEFELRFARSDRSSGSRFTFGSLELSTNAWLVSQGTKPDKMFKVTLGCGVLFAADVEADTLALAGEGVSENTERSARSLLGTVGLGLELR